MDIAFLAHPPAGTGPEIIEILELAAAQEISLHVLSKDGSTNVTKVVPMAPPGGFVPTLKVEIEDNKIAMTWQSSSKPKP